MVKSKKMSKTGIAVIVLAILLVLSMIMGLTGAWYTAGDTADGQDGYTFTLRDTWITITGTDSAQSLEVHRDLDGDGTFGEEGVNGEILSATAGDYTVMPGDRIIFSGTAASFTVTGTDACYYVFVKDGVAISAGAANEEAVRVAAGNSISLSYDAQSVTPVSNVEGSEAGLEDKSSYWEVNTDLTAASHGQRVASINAIDGYGLYAIQAENLSAADAYEILQDMFGFTTPSNNP